MADIVHPHHLSDAALLSYISDTVTTLLQRADDPVQTKFVEDGLYECALRVRQPGGGHDIAVLDAALLQYSLAALEALCGHPEQMRSVANLVCQFRAKKVEPVTQTWRTFVEGATRILINAYPIVAQGPPEMYYQYATRAVRMLIYWTARGETSAEALRADSTSTFSIFYDFAMRMIRTGEHGHLALRLCHATCMLGVESEAIRWSTLPREGREVLTKLAWEQLVLARATQGMSHVGGAAEMVGWTMDIHNGEIEVPEAGFGRLLAYLEDGIATTARNGSTAATSNEEHPALRAVNTVLSLLLSTGFGATHRPGIPLWMLPEVFSHQDDSSGKPHRSNLWILLERMIRLLKDATWESMVDPVIGDCEGLETILESVYHKLPVEQHAAFRELDGCLDFLMLRLRQRYDSISEFMLHGLFDDRPLSYPGQY